MANELSRVGDRLTRARERTWNGAASLFLPVQGRREARREPTRVPSAQARDRDRQYQARDDAAAENRRPPTTLVAIHVELRHPPDEAASSARFVEAHVDEVAAAHQHEFAIEDEAIGPAQPAYELDAHAEPVFALPALGSSTGTYTRQARVGSTVHYLAARAVSAYLAQQTFASASGAEPRLIDVRV